jgi:hypothetical protein
VAAASPDAINFQSGAAIVSRTTTLPVNHRGDREAVAACSQTVSLSPNEADPRFAYGQRLY